MPSGAWVPRLDEHIGPTLIALRLRRVVHRIAIHQRGAAAKYMSGAVPWLSSAPCPAASRSRSDQACESNSRKLRLREAVWFRAAVASVRMLPGFSLRRHAGDIAEVHMAVESSQEQDKGRNR